MQIILSSKCDCHEKLTSKFLAACLLNVTHQKFQFKKKYKKNVYKKKKKIKAKLNEKVMRAAL